jgi:hypothetical protein
MEVDGRTIAEVEIRIAERRTGREGKDQERNSFNQSFVAGTALLVERRVNQ